QPFLHAARLRLRLRGRRRRGLLLRRRRRRGLLLLGWSAALHAEVLSAAHAPGSLGIDRDERKTNEADQDREQFFHGSSCELAAVLGFHAARADWAAIIPSADECRRDMAGVRNSQEIQAVGCATRPPSQRAEYSVSS